MSLDRLARSDVLAVAAALVLLIVMALDWYGTVIGDEARRIEEISQPRGAQAGEVEREVAEDASTTAENAERNAWQPFAAIDSVILLGLLATVVLTIAAAYLRAAGKRFKPPLTPATVAAMIAGATALLIAYRTIQRPGFDEAATIKAGPPLALIVLGGLALACRASMRLEGEPEAEPAPVA